MSTASAFGWRERRTSCACSSLSGAAHHRSSIGCLAVQYSLILRLLPPAVCHKWHMIAQPQFRYPIRHTAKKERRIEVGDILNSPTEGTPRKIVDYYLDECCDWIAKLECGHQQHVRHNPPWTHRHWVTTPQGRFDHLGFELRCLVCPAPFSTVELL